MSNIWAWLASSVPIIRWEFILGMIYPLFLGYYLGRRR